MMRVFKLRVKKSTVVKNVSSNQASVSSSSASGQKLDVVGYVPVHSIKPSYNKPYNSRTSVSNRLDKYVRTLLNHVKDGQQSNDSNVVAGLSTVVHSLGPHSVLNIFGGNVDKFLVVAGSSRQHGVRHSFSYWSVMQWASKGINVLILTRVSASAAFWPFQFHKIDLKLAKIDES
ncbi:hypothetical protein HanRHA438_Chr05g0216371 [Helianthus annuus]|nr:hypothetical protein HanRHA438_Chr05g0216371 [Helianthus annuus]